MSNDKNAVTNAEASKTETKTEAEPEVKTEAKAEAKPEVKNLSASEALREPDGEAVPGKVVTKDQLVRCVHANMTDNLTKVTYSTDTWVDAVPSAWLDGQLRAGKIILK